MKLLKTHVQSLFMHSPPYYLIPFRCPSYSVSEIAHMVVELGALPSSLEVNMKCVPRRTFFESETNNKLLGNLRRVRVYCSYNAKELQNVLKHIVGYKRNSLNSVSKLESLELLNCTQHNIQSITSLLSSSQGYNHLRSLHISMQTHSASMRHLPGIIKHQINTLEELKLSKFELSFNAGVMGTSDYTLSIALSQFILRPQYRKLILEDFSNLPQMFAVNMIESFLRSIPNHKQTICFSNSKICVAGRVPFHVQRLDSDASEDGDTSIFHPACTEECTTYKHLVLDNVYLPVEFLDWMKSIESIYLNTLMLKDVTILPKLPPRRSLRMQQADYTQPCDPFQMFDSHPNMMCKTFVYSPKD